MKIDENMLILDLMLTANELEGNENRYFVEKNRDMFNALNESLFVNYEKAIISSDALGVETSEKLEKILELRMMREYKKFIQYTNSNEKTFINMSENYLKVFDDPLKYYVPMKGKKVFTDEELKDVILAFYSEFGEIPYKIACKYFDEKRIQTQNKDVDPGAGGFFACLPWLSSGYVFSNYQRNTVSTAAAIAHELGHAIDAEAFCFTQQRTGFNEMSDFLVEFPSTAYEMCFIDFLKKNHIASTDANKYFIGRMHLIRNYMEIISTVMKMKESIVDIDGYAVDEVDFKTLEEIYKEAVETYKKNKPKGVTDDSEAMQEYNEWFAEEMKSFEELEDSVSYNLRSALKYGFGYYAALHTRLIYEKDPKEFARIVHNICCARGRVTLENVINMMGYKVDEFTSGELMLPKIESEFLELKKRYKL